MKRIQSVLSTLMFFVLVKSPVWVLDLLTGREGAVCLSFVHPFPSRCAKTLVLVAFVLLIQTSVSVALTSLYWDTICITFSIRLKKKESERSFPQNGNLGSERVINDLTNTRFWSWWREKDQSTRCHPIKDPCDCFRDVPLGHRAEEIRAKGPGEYDDPHAPHTRTISLVISNTIPT